MVIDYRAVAERMALDIRSNYTEQNVFRRTLHTFKMGAWEKHSYVWFEWQNDVVCS